MENYIGIGLRNSLQTSKSYPSRFHVISFLCSFNDVRYSGVPAVVDLASMRDAMKRLGGDPNKINPLCPVDLVIDHSVQVDAARVKDAKE